MTERVVDLTLELTQGLQTWDMKPPATLLPYMTARYSRLGFNTRLLILEDHVGTHVDAPLHFYDGDLRAPAGSSVEALPLEKLIGRAVVLDLVRLRSRPTEAVGAEMLAAAEARAGLAIERGDIVLLRCWEDAWGQGGCFAALGIDAGGGEWLLRKGVHAVGIDLPNLEGAIEPPYPAHEALLRPGVEVPIIENLVGLDQLPPRPFRFVGLPLRVRGATGSPIRAAALVEE